MLKPTSSITYIEGVIGIKCGKTTLKFIKNDWINWETGEVFTAVVNVRNGKIKGFVPMPDNYSRYIYTRR